MLADWRLLVIGLSVHDCCREMALGRRNPETVSKIIACTGVKEPGEWDLAVRMYRDFFWDVQYAARAEEILRKFLRENRIEQPRFTDGLIPDVRHGCWVEYESEISWKKVSR
jgi:hypothetical protein